MSLGLAEDPGSSGRQILDDEYENHDEDDCDLSNDLILFFLLDAIDHLSGVR